MSSFQGRELLTKGQIFKMEATMGAEEAKKRAYQKPDATDHAKVLSHFACEGQRRILLKSKADRILARDRPNEQVPLNHRSPSEFCS